MIKSYASVISKIQKTSQYAFHGYSDKYSGPEGGGFDQPSASPIAPADRGTASRVYPWSLVDTDMKDEWGEHKGFRPDGTESKYIAKKCKACDGAGCQDCFGRGTIYKVRRKTEVPSGKKGRVGNQPNHNRVTWPHNRDVKRSPRQEVTTWQEHMKKPMLGKPNL